MSDNQAPAGWYAMPDGTRRYWDGEAWGMTEQEAWEASGPNVAARIPETITVVRAPVESGGIAWGWIVFALAGIALLVFLLLVMVGPAGGAS